jgi:hypothetical protein
MKFPTLLQCLLLVPSLPWLNAYPQTPPQAGQGPAAFPGAGRTRTQPTPPAFNEKADAAAAIKTAVGAAELNGIRVLIAWGANDDKGSSRFLESKRAPDVVKSALFADEYKTVNVSVGHLDKNIALAKSYDAKVTAEALPALTVLDAAGSVIANTNAAALRPDADPAGIDPAKLIAFLKSHQAPAPDAVASFEAALKKAKEENKSVFVWFSAPW